MLLRAMCLLVSLVLGCREPPLPGGPPPTFVAPRAATSLGGGGQVHWKPGESMVWSVTWRGLLIGTAELGVRGDPGALRIESRFRTVGLADQMNPVNHRLVTRLARSAQSMDDLHSALGRLRGWAAPQAAPATLTVRHAHRVYQVDFAAPRIDNSLPQRTLRIEGRARSGRRVIDMTMWLSADQDRTPLQVTLAQDGKQVHATLRASNSES